MWKIAIGGASETGVIIPAIHSGKSYVIFRPTEVRADREWLKTVQRGDGVRIHGTIERIELDRLVYLNSPYLPIVVYLSDAKVVK
jgi:hypothetical protein